MADLEIKMTASGTSEANSALGSVAGAATQAERAFASASAEVKVFVTHLGSVGGASQSAQSHLSGLSASLGSVGGAAQHATGFLSNMLSTAAGFALYNVAAKGLGAAFDAVKDSVIGFNSQMENAQIGFTAFTGSAQVARDTLNDLKQFAVTTPFKFPELVDSSQKLLAFGFAAKDLIPIMTAVGDVVAATGTVSAEKLNRVTLALGEIGTTGKVMERQMLQFTEAGIPAFDILSKGMDVSTGKLRDMIQKGLVPADQAIKILVEGMENRAPGAMEKMSHTLTGAISNIQDSFQQLSAGALKPIFDDLEHFANKLADVLMTDKVKAFASEVASAFDNLNKAMSALFSGDRAGAATYFDNFKTQAGSAAKEVELSFLHIADALLPAVEPVVETFANLAANAVVWGANLVVSFANGMIEAAGSVLETALGAIGDAIAGFLKFESPPKRGILRSIEIWGANMLQTFFGGMEQADFSAFDRIGKLVKDALTSQMDFGDFPKEGLVPRLVGAQEGVARALDDLRQFGAISEEALGTLNKYLGEDAPLVISLIDDFARLAALDHQLSELNRQIKDFDTQIRDAQHAVGDAQRPVNELDRQLAALTRTFDEQRRPIEAAIDAANRYYDSHIRGADEAVRAIDRQIAAVHRLHQPELDQLTTQERSLNLAIAQQTLAEAQGAAPLRTQRLQQDVTSAGLSLQGAQHSLATLAPGADAYTRASAQNAVAQAQLHLQEAQQKFATEGLTTERDRLSILNAQRAVIEAQVGVEAHGLEARKAGLQTELDKLKDEKDDAVTPLKAQLDDITEAHKNAVAAIELQKDPLVANLNAAKDHLQQLQDQKGVLEDQKADIEAQRQPLEDNLKLAETRLAHEMDISKEYKSQLDLLNQIASAGGAGRHPAAGHGAGGSTDLSHLGLRIPRVHGPIDTSTSIEDVEAQAARATARAAGMDAQLATLGQKVSDQFQKSVKEGFGKGFDDFGQDLKSRKVEVGVTLGVGAIDYKVFGPVGGIIGALIADDIVKSFVSGDAKTKLDIGLSAVAGTIAGYIFGGPVGALVGIQVGAWVGAHIVAPFSHAVDEGFTNADLGHLIMSTITFDWEGFWTPIGKLLTFLTNRAGDMAGGIGDAIVAGVRMGITDKWEEFSTWVSEQWDRLVASVKHLLGISSPSTVFHGIGTDIMTGLQNGVEEIWKTVSKWFTDLPGNIVSAVGTVTETLLDKGREVLQGMARGVAQLWADTGGLRDWFADLAKVPGGRIADAVGDGLQTLYTIGRNIVSGLWNGIQSLGGWLKSQVTGFINDNIPAPVRHLLGVESPSRLMFTIGENIVQGLLGGMKSKEDELNDYTKSLAIKLLGPFVSVGEAVARIAGGTPSMGNIASTSAGQLPFFAGRTPALGAGDITNYAFSSGTGQAALAYFASLGITPPSNMGTTAEGWEDIGGGSQLKWTGPDTYWVRDAAGRMSTFHTSDPAGPAYRPSPASNAAANGGSASPLVPNNGLIRPGQPQFGNPTQADAGTSLGLSPSDAAICLSNPFHRLPDGSMCYEHMGIDPWKMFNFGFNAAPMQGGGPGGAGHGMAPVQITIQGGTYVGPGGFDQLADYLTGRISQNLGGQMEAQGGAAFMTRT